MSYFLFCVEKPNRVPAVQESATSLKEWEFWQKVVQGIETTTKPVPGVQKPADNVWLIPATDGLLALSESVQACREHNQKFKVFFCEKEPVLCK